MIPSEKEILNVLEAAEFLGVSERTLRRLIAERRLPFARVGGLLRLRRTTLVEWLAAAERISAPAGPPREDEDRATRVRAIAGKYAHVPFSSEDLIAEKQEELRQDEPGWGDRR